MRDITETVWIHLGDELQEIYRNNPKGDLVDLIDSFRDHALSHFPSPGTIQGDMIHQLIDHVGWYTLLERSMALNEGDISNGN